MYNMTIGIDDNKNKIEMRMLNPMADILQNGSRWLL